MSPDGMSWKAKCGDVQLVLRQRGALEFQIEVGDGTLTHYHPAKGCDFNTAQLRAHEHVVRFARLRSQYDDDATRQVVTLEWEPVESTA